MFKLDLEGLFAGTSHRLTAKAANLANDQPEAVPLLADLAKLAISQGYEPVANHKTELEREMFEERAAIMEFEGGLDRDQAEQMARLHNQYMLHHWCCPTCCAAGQGRGNRCTTGAPLWNSYQDAEAALSATGSAKADRVTLMVGSRNEDRITQLCR